MITEIANLLDNFPGPANQTRCFAHILNLVVKSIIKQFDLPKKSKGNASLDEAARELEALARNIELEEDEWARREGNAEEEDDNIEGWIDERTLMTDDELNELDTSVKPIRLLLTKVVINLLIFK